MESARHRIRERRRGAFLAQAVIGTMLLILGLGMTAQLLGRLAQARGAAERRQFAVVAAANALERIALLDPIERDADRLAALGLDPEADAFLPEGVLAASIDEPDDSGLRRVVVEVRWQPPSGRIEAPVRLVTWFAGEGSP